MIVVSFQSLPMVMGFCGAYWLLICINIVGYKKLNRAGGLTAIQFELNPFASRMMQKIGFRRYLIIMGILVTIALSVSTYFFDESIFFIYIIGIISGAILFDVICDIMVINDRLKRIERKKQSK